MVNSDSPPANGTTTEMIASAAASAAITEAWAISTGDRERPARRSIDGRDGCAGASGLVAVITRFCQPPRTARRLDLPRSGAPVDML
ncbi:hypothetical protein GCM10010533_21450 [Mycolicibacterium pallens]